MAEANDVYAKWLGIKDANRPLTHYQLLRLKLFEDDFAKIRTHHQKMAEHIRKLATGEHQSRGDALLDELNQAMLCLTDVQRKRDYDASLGREDEIEAGRRSFEEILLGNGVCDADQLAKARKFADAVGLDLRDAVLQQKLAAPDVVMLAYAESIGLPFIELADLGVSEDLVPVIPPNVARQHSCVPVMGDDQHLLIASPNPLVPDVEDDLRLRLNKTIRTVICTPASINEAVAKHYPPEAVAAAAAQATSGQSAKQPAKAKAPVGPLTAEQKKQRLLLTVVGFNLGAMVTVFGLSMIRGGMYRLGIVDLFLALILATIIGAVTFVMAPKFS